MIEAVLLASALTLNHDLDWRPLRDADGVRSFRVDVDGSSHDAYRADGRVCADQMALFSLFQNVDGFVTWLPRTESAERIEGGDEFSPLIHVVSDAPWPMRSRDMVYRITLQTDLEGSSATVDIEGLPEHIPPRKGRVRLRSASGHWDINLADTHADLSFMLHIDVGRIPSALAARSLHHAVRNAIRNLQKLHPCDPVPPAVLEEP